MYHQFNIQQFYVLPTECIYVFCVDLRINRDDFPIQHKLIGFYNRAGGVFTARYGLNLYIHLYLILALSGLMAPPPSAGQRSANNARYVTASSHPPTHTRERA
jgi:hypothetical protein